MGRKNRGRDPYAESTYLSIEDDPAMSWVMMEPLKAVAFAKAAQIHAQARLMDTRKISDESLDRSMARGSVDIARAGELVNTVGLTGIADGTGEKLMKLARESRLHQPQAAPSGKRRRK